MYLELLIFPPPLSGTPINGDTARSIVAKACDGIAVDRRVFARTKDGATLNAIYVDSNGASIGKPPLVAFGGGKGFFRLTGLGAEGARVLRENAPTICTAVGNHYQSPCRFKLIEGECKLAQLHGFVRTYYIHRMLLAKKTNVFKRLGPVDKRLTLDDVRPLVVEQIKTGLIGQARSMDDSYRELGHAGQAALESSLGTDAMLNIEVHEGGPNFQGIKSGERVHGLFVNQVVFTMAVDLSGPWYCGKLRSRGNGLIFPR